MKHYILFYRTCEGYTEKRIPYRPEHLALVHRYKEAGHIVMAGALADPVDAAVLVFKVESAITVEEFVKQDPYVMAGLIPTWEIREWSIV